MRVSVTLTGFAGDELAAQIVKLAGDHSASWGMDRVRKETALLEKVVFGLTRTSMRLAFEEMDDPLQESLGLKVN